MTAVTWSDEIHDILTGDLTVAVVRPILGLAAPREQRAPRHRRRRRRAGLLAHRFGPRCSPLMMITGTGWLDTGGETVRYAPHTLKKLGTPPTKFLQSLGNGALAKYGYHRARRTGQLHRLETLAAQADPGDDAPTRPRVGLVQSGQEPEPS